MRLVRSFVLKTQCTSTQACVWDMRSGYASSNRRLGDLRHTPPFLYRPYGTRTCDDRLPSAEALGLDVLSASRTAVARQPSRDLRGTLVVRTEIQLGPSNDNRRLSPGPGLENRNTWSTN